ncbi:hypothetical protein IFM89_001290, partial [Coptis chinensis]
GLVFLVGAISNGAAKNVAMLSVDRLLLGVGVGFSNQFVPLYVSDMVPYKFRGALNIGFQLSITIGILAANIINYFTDNIKGGWGWRITGIIVIMFYAPVLFKTLDFGNNASLMSAVVTGLVNGVATCVSIYLADRKGRRICMVKIEGYTSLSVLDQRSATKYYLFVLANVFLGSIVTGTAFQQLPNFIKQSANEIPTTVGVSIPMKATFFITYIMVDGWAGVYGEILRLVPLVMFHLNNTFLVKIERDREHAMDLGSLDFASVEP